MRVRVRSLVAAVAVVGGLACATAPAASADDTVTPMCNGQPCAAGWYTSPVFLTWSWSGGSASSGCFTQDYEADVDQTVSCTVQFPDGSITRNYILKVEVDTPAPTATASPDRPPDSNGWYDHPVSVSFAGSAFSGIAWCTPTSTYSGPAGTNLVVSGSCVDNAGRTLPASLSLNYDASPPTITGATPSRSPDSGGYYTHPVSFKFTGTDAASGIESCDTVTYSGPESGYVTGGCHDRAGNYATIAVRVRYRKATPRASVARASSSLVLRWKAAAHATYYNVQVYRNGKKVLSAWPSATRLRLRRTWSFAGHRFRLKPGRYRWYVWPGYGSRGVAHYGRVWVSATFKVTKPL